MSALIARIDAILLPHTEALGRDHAAYRNHACRVALTHQLLDPAEGEAAERLAIAAAHHDLGIWTERTFDYIEPSVNMAARYLHAIGRDGWTAEVAAMIRNHHKLTRCEPAASRAAEAFRRADWIDVSGGLRRFGVSRAAVAALQRPLPCRGFHRRLLQLTLKHAATHPLHPLPMFRW